MVYIEKALHMYLLCYWTSGFGIHQDIFDTSPVILRMAAFSVRFYHVQSGDTLCRDTISIV